MIAAHPASVYVVAVLYYNNYATNLIRSLKKLGDCHKIEKIIVVLNNPAIDDAVLGRSLTTLAAQTACVTHDNTGQEFGAYQAGIDHIRTELTPRDCLVILNETLGIHYPFETEHAGAFMRSLLDRKYTGRAVGHIDHSIRRLCIDDLWTSRWVRSNLVGFDFEAISSIDYRVYVPRLHDYVRDTDVFDEFFSGNVDAYLQHHIADWLFSKGQWYAAATLSKGNAASFAIKARSILQEKHLSMRLENHKVAFVPARYKAAEQITRRAKNGLRRVSRAVGLMRPPRRT